MLWSRETPITSFFSFFPEITFYLGANQSIPEGKTE